MTGQSYLTDADAFDVLEVCAFRELASIEVHSCTWNTFILSDVDMLDTRWYWCVHKVICVYMMSQVYRHDASDVDTMI